jgi:hypothetical protein
VRNRTENVAVILRLPKEIGNQNPRCPNNPVIISHKTWCVKRSYLFGYIFYSAPTTPPATFTPPPTETPEPPPPTPTPTPFPEPSETLLPDEDPPFGADREFRTDFGRHSVPYSDILSGGPPKDGIPAIDNPKSITVEEVERKHRGAVGGVIRYIR